MDLENFTPEQLYCDKPSDPQVQYLLESASKSYADGAAEPLLLQAFQIAPNDLSVLVALYRFYFYQHRYPDALATAFQAMTAVAPLIGFPTQWPRIEQRHLEYGVLESFTLVRFYLFALKGAGLLQLRIGNHSEGVAMLRRVVALDANDRLGAAALLHAIGASAEETGSHNNKDSARRLPRTADQPAGDTIGWR